MIKTFRKKPLFPLMEIFQVSSTWFFWTWPPPFALNSNRTNLLALLKAESWHKMCGTSSQHNFYYVGNDKEGCDLVTDQQKSDTWLKLRIEYCLANRIWTDLQGFQIYFFLCWKNSRVHAQFQWKIFRMCNQISL